MNIQSKEFVDTTKRMIDLSLTSRGGISPSYIALSILELDQGFYIGYMNDLKRMIDPYIRDEVCYLKDKEEHEVRGTKLIDYFKKDLEYRGCDLIITILGLENGPRYNIKLILKSFNEVSVDRQMALAMSQHPRLNAQSEMGFLNGDALRSIFTYGRMAHVDPLEYQTCDHNIMNELLEYIFEKELFRIDFEVESMVKQRSSFRKSLQFQISNKTLLDILYDDVDRKMSNRITTRTRGFFTLPRREIRTLRMNLASDVICSISFDSNPLSITAEIRHGGGSGDGLEDVRFVNDDSFDIFMNKLTNNFI